MRVEMPEYSTTAFKHVGKGNLFFWPLPHQQAHPKFEKAALWMHCGSETAVDLETGDTSSFSDYEAVFPTLGHVVITGPCPNK